MSTWNKLNIKKLVLGAEGQLKVSDDLINSLRLFDI